MVRFEPFYRRFGVYRAEQLSAPRLFDMVDVEFPTGSVFHYLPEDLTDWGPEPTWWMIRKTAGHVWVDHVTEFQPSHGKVIPVPGNPMQFIRKFHQKYPSLKRVLKLDVPLGNATSAIVINHALARHFFRYQNTRFLEYHRNLNTRDNVFKAVAEMVNGIDRQHFIPVKMPTTLPSLSHIQRAEESMENVESINRFTSIERLMFLEVWKWLGDPKNSVIDELPAEKLSKVNFVFIVRGNWFFVNLGDLGAMRRSEENPKGKYEPIQLQRRFLNGLISLIEAGVRAEKKPDGELSDLDSEQSPKENEKPISEIQQHNSAVLSQVPVSREISSKVLKNQPTTLANIGVDNSQATTKVSPTVEAEVAAKEQAALEAERSENSSRASLAGRVSTELTDEEIDANLEALEKVEQIQTGDDFAQPANPNADPLEEGILSRGRALAKDGLVSGAEFRRIEEMSKAYKKIKNPYGPGLLHEAAKVTREETVVEPATYEVKGPIFDKSMLASSVREMNKRYVSSTMKKDVVNCVLAMQRSGIAITSFEVDKSKTVLGEQDIVSIRVQPVGGAASTLRAVLPVVNEEGVFKAGGTRYRMRTQRVDVPIRKVAPGRVSLTSYYGKINVSLSERAVHNYPRWLNEQISALTIDNSPLVKDVRFSNVFDQSFKAPKAYSTLARTVHSMQVGDMILNFKHQERRGLVKENELAKLEEGGKVLVGLTTSNQTVLMDQDGNFLVKGQNRGRIEDLLQLDLSGAPHQMAVIKVRGQHLPLGVVLASYYGFSNLLTLLQTKTRRVLAGDRANLEKHEYPIRFSDETLVLDTRDPLSMMLVSGFRFYHKQIRQMSIYSFDQKAAYHHLFDANSRNGLYSVELELLDEQFVDPMTRDVLAEMKEPTEWRPLLMRAAQLLMTDYSPDEVDGAYMLYKGYERVPGALYRELVVAMRQYKLRSRVTKAAVDMKPTAVWNSLTDDAAISPVNDCNPIADLRASEAVTYIGAGGRSKRSMVARTRKYHKNDKGVVSEATVDSGDVGINVYMTANPRIVSTRGLAIAGTTDEEKLEPANMVSTSAMLSPGADIDDPKRVNFIGIQHGSGIGAVGYRTMPYSTGYEQVIAHRAGKKFAYAATGKGVVTSIKSNVMRITYEDGTVDAVEIGRVFTSGEGHTYPNDLVATVKAGDKVEKGDVLVYNNAFFEPSPFGKRQVSYRHGVPVRVALFESVNTLEDSSVITPRVSEAMKAHETDIRDIVIDFKTTVHQLVQEGEEVEPDDILCTMEDPSSEAANLFSEETVESLQLLVDKSPKAKLHGVVDRVEILYNGDLEDMSPTLRKLVEESDRRLRARMRELGEPIEGGRVDESLRIKNQPLQVDTLVIRVYISHGRAAYAGDKGVLGNQMKSVFGQVHHGELETESGVQLDMYFSDKSIEDRIVRSARKAGMMNGLLIHIGKNVVKTYRGK